MKKALGKGLSALIPDTYTKAQEAKPEQKSAAKPSVSAKPATNQDAFRLVSIEQITPNHDQVRTEFDPEAIEELASSIKEKGILQPILVKQTGENGFEIICGERRFRAAQLCGLTQVPVVIRDIADDDFLEWALIENVQREDLNVIEEAEAYKRLAEERRLSQDEIAKKVGKNRTTITNTLRLLQLPIEIRRLIEENMLTAGHARALLSMVSPEHQRKLAKRIVEENLSVRQVEVLASKSPGRKRKAKIARHLSPEIIALEERLTQHFGTHVKLYPKKSKDQGRLEIQYFSLDDLDRILDKMQLPAEDA